tara:strand:+ start:19 stop:348 length:330 start_codon:yes stop_codon:yes gene_type:complete
MKKTIRVNINTTYKYLQIWNGIFNLTDKELEILAAFIDTQEITQDINLCSIPNKKQVARMVGIKDFNTLNNYIKKFKDKGVMLKSMNTYKLNSAFDTNTDKIEIIIDKN